MGRYVAGESPAMDRLVEETVECIGASIDAMRIPRLGGVVLGGGYGRGEGGVYVDPAGGEHLYNDLDFYVVSADGASGAELAAIDAALAPFSAEWTRRLGVHVDFSPAKTPWRIKHDEERVMIQELVHGYVDVAGLPGEELFSRVGRRPPDAFPLTEAVRLLMNRGVGLVLAMESDDAAFAARNVNKCVLGAGDAALIARHAYEWKTADRAAALGWPEYDAAMAWKFRPSADCPCDWETARRLWLKALDEVESACRRGGARRRSLYQAARWLARRRTVGCLRTFGMEAEVRILKALTRLVAERRPLPDRLLRDWKIFN